jgi:hypothetical protein
MENKEEICSCSFIPTTLLYSISTEDVKKEELDLEDPKNAEEIIDASQITCLSVWEQGVPGTGQYTT